MAIFDFLRKKKIDVTSVSGTPTISRTMCLKIAGSDDSTTGTGEIVLDWSNISSKADIGVYDENDNLLDYYFESFDETEEKAVIWVFRDWVQDGSTQLQIAYGDGPSDQSVSSEMVFDKESDLEAGYLFNESSGDLLDVTSNNNNGTLNGGVTQGETGIVDGAYELNGSDGYIDTNIDSGDLDGDISFSFLMKPNTIKDSALISAYGGKGENRWDIQLDREGNGKVGWVEHENSLYLTSTTSFSPGDEAFITVTRNSSNNEIKIYVNGSEENSDSFQQGLDTGKNVLIGQGDRENYDGIFDNTFFHRSVLSLEEHKALYDSTKSSPDFFSQQAGEATGIILDGITLEFLLGANTGVLTTSNVLQGTEVALPLTIDPGSDISGYELTLSEVELPLTSDEGTLTYGDSQELVGTSLDLSLSHDAGALTCGELLDGVVLDLSLSADQGTSVQGIFVESPVLDVSLTANTGTLTYGHLIDASVLSLTFSTDEGTPSFGEETAGTTLNLTLTADAGTVSGESIAVEIVGTTIDLSLSPGEGTPTYGNNLHANEATLDLISPNGKLYISVLLFGGEIVSNLSVASAQLMLGQEMIGTLEELPYTGVAGSLIRGHQLEGTVIELELLSMSGTNKPWVPIEEPILYGGSRSLSDLLACRSMSLMRATTTQSDKLTNVDRS